MERKKKANLMLEELIDNESFQRWVYENKKLDKKYWESYVSKNLDTYEIVEEAKAYLIAFRKIEKAGPYNSKRKVWFNIESYQKRKIRFRYYYSAAASVLIFLMLGSGWYFYNQTLLNDVFARLNQEVDFSQTTDIKLILSDDEEHKISGDQSNIMFNERGKQVIINEEKLDLDGQAEKQMNQIIVPFGKRTNLTLEDGTLVYLNAGSKLIFPPHFVKGKREVYLMGEAYFEVFRNEQSPFYVITNEHKIKVLGTKFNVKAYGESPTVSTVLIEGKVALQTENLLGFVTNEVFLEPNQRAVFRKGKKQFSIKDEPNALFYASWKDGWMYFSKQSLRSVLAQIERYYNIKFETALISSYDNKKISGKLDLKDSLNEVLNVISRLGQVSFQNEVGKIKVLKRS